MKFKLQCHGRGILGCDMHQQYEKGITYCICDNVREKLIVKWYEKRKARQKGRWHVNILAYAELDSNLAG